jgi:hypothetical protein
MIHIFLALIAQAAFAIPTGHWFAGGLIGSALFLGREHAQAEHRWIETYGQHKRANMPWWGGFDPRAWGRKSTLDWLAPLASTLIAAFLIQGA